MYVKIPRKCEECEVDISGRHGNARLCLDCKSKRKRENSQRYEEKRPPRDRREYNRAYESKKWRTDPEYRKRRNRIKSDYRRRRRKLDPEYKAREKADKKFREKLRKRSNIDLMWERDGNICGWCLLELVWREKDRYDGSLVHVYHRVALCNGGESVIENLQLVHSACNIEKGKG